MYEKERNLINFLLNTHRHTTNAEIQKNLNISRRTVINYINNINATYENLIVSSRKGYIISDEKKAIEIIKEDDSQVSIEGYENRKKYILQRLVFNSDIIDIDDLANELCISPYTFKKDIGHLQTELKEHELYIKTKNNKIYLIGKDQKKKKYIMNLLTKEVEYYPFSWESLQKLFVHANIETIRHIIMETINNHNSFLDEYSLFNYAIHLSIYIESAMNTPQETHEENLMENYHYSEFIQNIITDIYHRLQEEYKIPLSINQISEASILMATRVVSKDYDQLSFEQLESILGEETIHLVNHIVQAIHEIYGVNLRSDSFLVRFSLHLKNVLVRSRNQIDMPRNQFIDMKDDFPFLYFMASYIGSLITQYTNFSLSEVEISYIALHLGILMEERKKYDKYINCIIVLYDYYNVGKLLFQQINNHIKGLYLMNIVSSYKQINFDDVDLIITTLPIDPSYNIPMVKVNMIPNQNDIDQISSLINDIKSKKGSNKLERDIRRLFKKNLFYSQTDFQNRDEVIHSLCDCMASHGYVDSLFKNAIFTREEIASSAYRHIAIPHPIYIDEQLIRESAISVVINNKPIQWGQDKVDFVFLLALKKEDRQLFKDLFDMLINLLLDEISASLHDCKDYDSFVNFILKNYK